MPRPRLIEEDKRVYNLVLGETMFGELHQIAFDQSKQQGKMVSVAQLSNHEVFR
jgi:hypothetical protein